MPSTPQPSTRVRSNLGCARFGGSTEQLVRLAAAYLLARAEPLLQTLGLSASYLSMHFHGEELHGCGAAGLGV